MISLMFRKGYVDIGELGRLIEKRQTEGDAHTQRRICIAFPTRDGCPLPDSRKDDASQ